MDEGDILRRRIEALRARIDGIGPDKLSRRGVFKGRVRDGGAMPTSTPAMFLTHPVDTTCDEAEGAVPSDIPGNSGVPVLVFGAVPSVDDDLIAKQIGPLWVARKRMGGYPVTHCIPCAIPRRTLNVDMSALPNGFGPAFCPAGSSTMTWVNGTFTYWQGAFGLGYFSVTGGTNGGYWVSDCMSFATDYDACYGSGGGGNISGSIRCYMWCSPGGHIVFTRSETDFTGSSHCDDPPGALDPAGTTHPMECPPPISMSATGGCDPLGLTGFQILGGGSTTLMFGVSEP